MDVYQRARVVLNRGNSLCPLSELQAAVLLPQLGKLDARNTRREANVALLGQHLQSLPGLRLFCNTVAESRPAYYKLGLQFDSVQFGLPRDRLIAAVQAEGVAVDEGFRALHVGRSPTRLRKGSELAEADRAHRGAVVLHHPVLLGAVTDIEEVVQALRKVHANAALLGTSDWAPTVG
jgi:dTDP-4-amino-4,6-dideoxygalactose transaminase